MKRAIDSSGESCVGPCVSYVTFSNAGLRPYARQKSIGGEPSSSSKV